MRRGIAFAIAIGAVGCKPADKRPAAEPPPAVKPTAGPVVARPTRVPAFVTLDELTARQPALTGVRVIAPLTLDDSGKQGRATACIVTADAAAAGTAIAAQYVAAGWKPPTVQGSSFAADFDIADGAVHVQGQVRKAAACNAGELGLELSYTKMVPLDRVPAPPPSGDRTRPAPPPR